MSKEERLNTFPKSMKPNQNADVVFWENGKSNEYGDANIDEDMGIRYNDDIDIPHHGTDAAIGEPLLPKW